MQIVFISKKFVVLFALVSVYPKVNSIEITREPLITVTNFISSKTKQRRANNQWWITFLKRLSLGCSIS